MANPWANYQPILARPDTTLDPVYGAQISARPATLREKLADFLGLDNKHDVQNLMRMTGEGEVTNPIGAPFNIHQGGMKIAEGDPVGGSIDIAANSPGAGAVLGKAALLGKIGLGKAIAGAGTLIPAAERGAAKVVKKGAEKVLDYAKYLHEQGLPGSEIFRQTGWYIGSEGKWTQSISNKAASTAAKLSSQAPGATAELTQPFGRIGAGEKAPLLGGYPTTKPGRILSETEKGGYSVHLPTGEIPTTGLMSGVYRNDDARNMVLTGKPTQRDLADFVQTNQKQLENQRYMGGWKEGDTGNTYFDVVRRFEPDEVRRATKFAEGTEQKKIYDIGAGQELPVGNWDEFVQGPEYAARMHELRNEGVDYLKDFPNPDWWAMPNIRRVYGDKNMPQSIGFMSATSVNNAPPPNVQQMTEYMRRHLKGEPIIQPDYRIPETAMGGAAGHPGSTIGLETDPRQVEKWRRQRGGYGDNSGATPPIPAEGLGGRSYNLQAAARGDLEAMRGAVVREKNAAMSGDPWEAVLDRIHVRATEAPERGIFAHAEEATSPSGTPRQDLSRARWKASMAEEAHAAGTDLNKFSAELWTGIRERVKRTGELFGQKLEKTQAQTLSQESKSYDDLFVDFVKAKAEHLGISVAEMEKRLAAGDAELLSAFLAIPAAGAAGYGAYQAGGTKQNGGT